MTDSAINLRTDEGLQTALDRALAPEAGERYSRVSDFAADVVRASERTPVLVSPKAAVTTTAPTPVSIPVQQPAIKAPPKRQPMWPIFAWLILLGGIGTGLYYMQEIERRLGLLPMHAAPATSVVVPKPVPDSASQVAVIPQGEPDDSLNGSSTAPADDVKTPVPNVTKPPVTTTQSSPATTASNPTVHNDSAAPAHSMLRHPWLRANGDSGTARALDEGIAPDVLHQLQMEELQGHLALMRRFAARGDVAHARGAYRDAADEARGLQLTDQNMSQRIMLMLSIAQREAMQACQAAHADTLNPFRTQMDCGTLFAW